MTSKTHIESRLIRLNKPSDKVFEIFSDLNNFSAMVPEEAKRSAELQTTTDTLSAKVKGFVLGVQIADRIPYSTIRFSNFSQLPISFDFFINLERLSDQETSLKMTLDTELSGMIKMMIGGKLQEVIDKMADAIEKSFV